MNHLFCFGMGFSARALAETLRQRGWRVSGTSRRPSDAPDMHRFDRDHPLDPALFQTCSHILTSIAPDEQGDPVLDLHGADLRASKASWVGYLSTTGVYGDRGGDWVDETGDLRPAGARGQRRVDAEQGWRDTGLPVHLFRLAGIYGPGRSALDTVREGRARRIIKPGQFFSRIHVDDIAAVLLASITHPNPGAAYNVADDLPAPPQDVIAHACRLLGMAIPPDTPFAQAELSPMAASFYAENKRVRNDRIRTDLGVTLTYPTYREGLAALLANS
jgi:nucleoside-diphosphate-sugar epimerase